MKEPNGWPLELVRGRPVLNAMRRACCCVRWLMWCVTLGRYMRQRKYYRLIMGIDYAKTPDSSVVCVMQSDGQKRA